MLKVNKIVNLIKNGKFEVSARKLLPLKKNKIRIKIKAVGICASDIPRAHDNGAYNYPLVMGHEMTGEIFESHLKEFKTGDRAVIFPLIPCKKCKYCREKKYNHCTNYSYYGSREDGGYANYIDVYPWNILKIEKKISFLDSFALEPSAVALNTINTLFQDKPKKKEKILVLGSGFIGLLIINLLKIKYKKLNLTVVDRNDHKLKMPTYLQNDPHILSQKSYTFSKLFQYLTQSLILNHRKKFFSSIQQCYKFHHCRQL